MKNTESLCIVYVGGESESTYQVTDRETENWGEGKHWKIAVDHSRKRGGKANGRGREKKFSPICRYVPTSLFSFLSYTYSHITDDCDAFRKDTDKRQKKKKKMYTSMFLFTHTQRTHWGVITSSPVMFLILFGKCRILIIPLASAK